MMLACDSCEQSLVCAMKQQTISFLTGIALVLKTLLQKSMQPSSASKMGLNFWKIHIFLHNPREEDDFFDDSDFSDNSEIEIPIVLTVDNEVDDL